MQLELQRYYNAQTLHTGQHFDNNMSNVFFNELSIPKPDFLLNHGGGLKQGEQTALMMIDIERICADAKPDLMVVYGDTNSTLAGALVAAKMGIPQVHIEAGLRSFNRAMPEEVNRIIADTFADMLFCPTKAAIENLKKEGIDSSKIFKTADVMCDSLKMVEPKLKQVYHEKYMYVTLHRPYNVDNEDRLSDILSILNKLPYKIIFSLHPRTKSVLDKQGFDGKNNPNITFIEPQSYTDNLGLQKFSQVIITDSGGIQKEAYMLRKKCITLRSETEWTETLKGGWNHLVFDNLEEIETLISYKPTEYVENLFGNGNAAQEIVDLIRSKF